MPACKTQCPLVKAALKKTITEAPWLAKKYFPPKEADLEKDVEFEDVGRPYKREADGKVIDIVTDITKEDTSKVSITKVKRESATQWTVKGEDKVIVREPIKDIEGEDSAARLSERGRLEREQPEREKLEHEKLEHGKLELEKLEHKKLELEKLERKKLELKELEREKLERGKLELEKLERKKLELEKLESKKLELEKLEREKLEREKLEREKIIKPNGEPLRDDTIDEKVIKDECDPRCPRRISRKSIRRKLEERQSAVDYYLLNKGSGYFEDVCTCSLSCVVHALKNDSFVRSILASTALFVFGLKLCSELDAWYLPTRFS